MYGERFVLFDIASVLETKKCANPFYIGLYKFEVMLTLLAFLLFFAEKFVNIA